MKQNINEAFTTEESKEIYDNFLSIVGTRRDNLVKKYGSGAEQVAYATAVNQVKKKAATKIEEPMENVKLKEMVKAALSEKPKKFPDLTGDGKVTKADILKARGVELDEAENIGLADISEIGYEAGEKAFELIKDKFKNKPDHNAYRKGFFQGYIDNQSSYGYGLNEDLDLGHQDNEPHMLKADLYRIGKYAMELYQMMDDLEGQGEVDFPHWWQSKISNAKSAIVGAKHYLDFELKEPQVDAMVGAASKPLEENTWPKELTSKYSDEYRFELQKVEPTYKDQPGRAKYHVIDIESGELKGTPVFGKVESLMAFADDLIKPQGGTQSTNLGEIDMNDPVLMKMRAANAGDDGNDEFFDNAKKTTNPDYAAVKNAKKIAFLKKERAQLMRDMEQEAEPEGGPIADEYGSKLNRIDAAIAKLSGRKEMTYDQAIAESDSKIVNESKKERIKRAVTAYYQAKK